MTSATGSLDIYMIAIGGTGMAPLACLLRELGHRVRGSDGPLYPPMSELLAAAGIEPAVGFDPAHLEPRPDLVVVGNAVPRHNPEAAAAEALGLPRCSMPEAVARFLLEGRRSLVIAGSHGKTTTSSLAAWVWERCGEDPGYLIGGWPIGLPSSFRLGSGKRFIIEGDEYNAAYFDRGPKFLHYRPQTLILTSVEYDHADLYPSHEALLARYSELIALLPPEGLLVACWDDPELRRLAAVAPCRVVSYGRHREADVRVADIRTDSKGMDLELMLEGDREVLRLRLFGEHNASNAAAVWAAAQGDGLVRDQVRESMALFAGVRRRLELLGEASGVAVVDDFAHHPTEVRRSLEGLRARFMNRRLVVLFEPRSLTAGRALFHDAYREAFSLADHLILAPIFHAARLDAELRLDLERLAHELEAAGVAAEVAASNDAVLARARALLRPGDVLVTMSSGSFDGMPRRIFESLRETVRPPA
jgi:UDP-N-acetylmuramate: L-alanyl-gamma-D-glutamyl-meso-diaminopimelate ligase